MKNLRTRQLVLSQINMVFPWFSTESTDSSARTPNFQRLYHCLRNVQTLILCLSGYVLIPYTCRMRRRHLVYALHALHAPYSGWLRNSKHGTCRGLEMSRGSCGALVLVLCNVSAGQNHTAMLHPSEIQSPSINLPVLDI